MNKVDQWRAESMVGSAAILVLHASAQMQQK